jgi:hypothetical protein
VVVVAIDHSARNDAGQFSKAYWVVDPNHPHVGIYIDESFTDHFDPGPFSLMGPSEPQLGDGLQVVGYLDTESAFDDGDGYRSVIRDAAGGHCVANPPAGMQSFMSVTRMRIVAPPADNAVGPGFGNANGGSVRANPELAGTRVFIPGPIELTNPRPSAFQQVSSMPGDDAYSGFEVTGGVLVNDSKTAGSCDWRARVIDGGTVTFPLGIRGVWDSYTYAPCADGSASSSCLRDAGSIPGAAGVTSTLVLYPQDCVRDFAGADAGSSP